MCDKLENQAFYANANAHRPPPRRCLHQHLQQQQQRTFSLTSFYHFTFSPVWLLWLLFFSFSYFFLHMVFANYSSKWNYSYATFSILIKTAKQFRSSSNSSFDIFVCLRKCRRENLSWLLCKKIKCVLSEINFIAALSEREKRERREWKGSTAEDYKARVRSGIRIDFFIAILFDCAHTKLRIRNVETSTVTSR